MDGALKQGLLDFHAAFKKGGFAAVDYTQKRIGATLRDALPEFLGEQGPSIPFHEPWCAFEANAFLLAELYRDGDEAERAELRAFLQEHPPMRVGLMHVVEWSLPMMHRGVFPRERIQALYDFFAIMDEPMNFRRFTGTLSALWDVCDSRGLDPKSYQLAAAAIARPAYAPVLEAFTPVNLGTWPG
ncbi:hypothetical protein [Acanthopleuribacter pedis]|uniref:Uncharacterized protein n=1 Tax=Acanthopleuribacter pedis TaxID=442870 RepID=A0A8J7QK96_9BACT|nr:hypothetical protein [Acanthopleuribacter pedis]MBO1322526.1 hypothetical protein [Acanthopleuribacter pedis]